MKRILNIKELTFQDTKYNCEKCRDTTWLINEDGATRCDCFEKEIIHRRWKKFGVNPQDIKFIKEYEIDNETRKKAREKAIDYIKKFDETRNTKQNSICFLGQPGSGKTHLALGIGKALLERENNVEVVYMPYLEAIKELKSNAMEQENYIKIQSKYIECELLIIDDLFKDKVKKGKLYSELNESDMKHIYPIINQRYINKKATIYSSECNPVMIMDLDEALGGRIIESCGDNIIVFKYTQENNYRLKNLY